MFTLISKIVGYFVKGDYANNTELPSWSNVEQNNCLSTEEFPWLIQKADNFKFRPLQGKVTHVFHNHGLINGDVYFSMSDVRGGDKLQVGDSVDVRAVQHHEGGGWHAEDITITTHTWDQQTQDEPKEIDLGVLQSEIVIGTVTGICNGDGLIDKDIAFVVDECQDGFLPIKGDWVSANVREWDTKNDHNDGVWWEESVVQVRRAYNICPARTIHLEGCVTGVLKDHGYINEEIFFTRTACLNGYQPTRNATVKVVAIESRQGKCEWRAVSVVPLSSESDVYRSKQFQHPSKQVNGSWLVPGQRPKSFSPKVVLSVKLPQFTVPDKLEQAVLEGSELTDVVPQLTQDLSFHNYSCRMSTLLYLEEIQMQMDILEYDMNRLTSTDVHLKFNPEFHHRYSGEDYNVQFTFNRTPLRRCHQAVSLAVLYLRSKVLFPHQVELKKPQVSLDSLTPSMDVSSGNSVASCSKLAAVTDQNVNQLRQSGNPLSTYSSQDVRSQSSTGVQGFFNPRLNERQKLAVRRIVLGQARPVPYVIFGPPGTGKTITVVEAILQVLHRVSSSRILTCTPSNSAADLIAERLHASGQVQQTQMVRLNAFQRSVHSIPESILKYCRFAEDMQMISRFRVIVSTCTMAGNLYGLGLTPGHITHVFVDECGQATEPECLVPVGLISGADGQIVLAGDPKQLGPIVMSPFAKMYGLELSFLERLMMRKPYQRNEELFEDDGGFDSLLVTMLVDNYRSHPAILELSSLLFYYNQLVPRADTQLTHVLAEWQELPKPGFPVIFHGIKGEDMRDTDSPSWLNPGEVIQVVQYLQGVLTAGVCPDDIGIITPYRKQVEKIRLMIDRLHLPDVKVGSVEEFQGQERQAIIISTVRSNERLVGFDIRHTLGFLSNPKRFNVSVTRAQALLIIVGNPVVLSQDPSWRTLIQYCVEKGGYIGCKLPDISVNDSVGNNNSEGM